MEPFLHRQIVPPLPHTTFYKYRTSITDIPREKLNLEQSYNYAAFGQTELKSSSSRKNTEHAIY